MHIANLNGQMCIGWYRKLINGEKNQMDEKKEGLVSIGMTAFKTILFGLRPLLSQASAAW